ncbi:MAG TPA: ABC transporter substrate-binding protein [Planctomycetota bacterium]|nr:ABC transporter substrate-binding protein [Planctomycetota bacterium]
MKRTLVILGCFLAVSLGLFVVVGLLARATWALSGAGTTPLESVQGLAVPERNPSEPKAVHSVAEWAGERGRGFQEAPMLAERVKAGALPPVAERLPEDPLVIVPPEQRGPYGGTWARFATDTNDTGVYEARIAYEGLVRWDAMGRRILPNLATRWEVADGGRAYTFWLRRGVRWSDGAPFSADDLLFWFNDVLQNPELTPVAPIDFRRGGELAKLEKLDGHTVRFRFKEPHGLFLQQMASGLSYTLLGYPAHYLRQFHPRYVPKEELEAKAKAMGFHFWYQLFGERRGWRNPQCPRLWAWLIQDPAALPVVFQRNPYYWKVDPDGRQLPYLDRVTFGIFDVETINLKAINGEMGMQSRHMDFANYPLFMENRKRGGYRVLHWVNAGGSVMQLALNLNQKTDPVLRELFGDPRFRIALSHAIDRDAINEVCYFGIGKPRQLCPPAASPYYSPEYERAHIEHDPARASALLDAMGLSARDADGVRLRPDGAPLSIFIETTSMTGNAKMLEMVARDWTAVGVKTELKITARQLYYTRKAALLHHVGVWWPADELVPLIDPRWFLPFSTESVHAIGYARWFTSGGKAGVEPAGDLRRCIDLYRAIQQTPDEAEHRRLFAEIIELNRKNLWVIGTIGEVPSLVLAQDRFRNVPEIAVYGWIFRSPGNTAPECYAMEGR